MGEGDIVSGLNAFLWDAIQARYPVFFIRRDLHAMQPLFFRIRSAGMAVKQCHVWQNEYIKQKNYTERNREDGFGYYEKVGRPL